MSRSNFHFFADACKIGIARYVVKPESGSFNELLLSIAFKGKKYVSLVVVKYF